MDEIYVFAEQELKKLITQLNEAAKNTEAKITELKDLLKIAANPAAATTAPSNSIRELLLNAPEEIGESIYIGEAIPRDDRIAFTENALYFWDSNGRYLIKPCRNHYVIQNIVVVYALFS